MLQVYGPLQLYGSGDARSRFLAPMWKHVAKLSMLIWNTHEGMLEGRVTTHGRIEYQFRIEFGTVRPD